MMEELSKELQEIGLSEKEAKVYLATLELGQETVQNISKKSGVNRATTYVVLEALQKKGIVSTFEEGKKALFIAEGPHALYNIIREQEEELERKDNDLDEMMPELMSVYNLHPEKPKVTFYEGKEGLKRMQEDFLNSGATEAVEFFYLNDVRNVFTKEEQEIFGKKRRDKKIFIQAIFTNGDDSTENSQEQVNIHEDKLTKSIALPDNQHKFSSDIIVYGNKVWMASLKGHLSGVIVESDEISNTIKSIFNLSSSNFINK